MLHRSTRNLLCRFLAGVLLYGQLAVAAYACPGPSAMTAAHHDAMQATHAQGSAGEVPMACDEMVAPSDAGSANLCAEHCHQGQQSDQVHAVSVPVVALASSYPLPAADAVLLGTGPAAAPADAIAPAPPPHAVLHCCLRI